MNCGSLNWNERDGEGSISKSLSKRMDSLHVVSAMDALNDWIYDLEREYMRQMNRLVPGKMEPLP